MSYVQQLVEVFPDIMEEFLRGVCDAYKDEGPSLDELIELVLSFEYPPLKEVNAPAELNNAAEPSSAVAQAERKTGDNLAVVEAAAITEDVNVRECSVLVTSSNHDRNLIETENVRETPVVNECDKIIDINGASNVQESTVICAAEMKASCTSLDSVGSYENNSTASLVSEVGDRDGDQVDPDEVYANKTNTDPLEAHLIEGMQNLESNSDDRNHELVQVLLSENNIEEANKVNVKINGNGGRPAEEQNSFILISSTNPGTNLTLHVAGNAVVEQAETVVEKNSEILIFSANPIDNNDSSVVSASQNNSNSTNDMVNEIEVLKNTNPVNSLQIISKSSENIANNGQSNCAQAGNLATSKKKLQRLNSASSGNGPSSSHHSLRPASFRSCKVKNDEQRLRAKLIRQNRLSVENKIKKEQNNKSQFVNSDSTYSLLTKILPDGDPSYLSAKSQKLTSPEELLQFISESLDSRNYPKIMEEKEEESKVMDSFECTIEEFLQGIPDPLAEFSSDYYIRTGYEENAEIYLQYRYRGMEEDLIKERLADGRYNLTKVCAQLDSEGFIPGPYKLNSVALHHPPSVFFHQEVWFIEHRNEILSYLDNAVQAAKIEEELNRPPTPPVVDEVFECEICVNEIVEYSQLGTCDGPSGHLFCKNCIRRSTEVLFAEGATRFPCLNNCGGFIPLQTIEELLPAQTFSILMNKIQEAEVRAANIAGVETCPFCPFAYGPGDEHVFTCLNPACSQLSCRACRKKDHRPELCNMFKEEDLETARHFVEDRMTEALVRECYKCGKKFVKEAGCNKMTCRCGAIMCYLCRQPVTDYSHFNGQGGTNYDRCELYSEEATVHTQPVAASARQAFDQLIANNPGIKLDASQIIP